MSHYSRIFCLLPVLLVVGCNSQHVLVKKADFSAAEQCLLQQQAQLQQMQLQQQQLHDMLATLNNTLAQPLRLDAPLPAAQACQPAADTRQPPAVSAPAAALPATAVDGKQVVGEIEKVWLPHLDMILTARIDTGATTASLDARDIQVFERDGEQWVRFTLVDGEQSRTFERKRVRKVRIIQSNSDDAERRPVIELQVSLGNITQMAEFTLSDRSHLDYSVLIGRNILRDVMVVDVSGRHLAPLDSREP